MLATSGTVSTYSFSLRKVIEHAFRRAGLMPEEASSEQLQIAQDLVFSQTSEWINAGFPLWTRQYLLLGPSLNSPEVACPIGTVDVLHAYWRIFQPYRGAAALTTGADATALFAGQPNADATIAGPSPGVSVAFASATEIDTIGVLGGATSLTGALEVQTAPDGTTWTTVATLPSTTFTQGAWSYFDLDPVIVAPYVRVIAPSAASWTVNQFNFGLANGEDIMIGPLNIDDYYNQPDKQRTSDRPNSAFVDRQLNQPVIKLWPAPSQSAFYNGAIGVLARRYIQDPGALSNAVEVPQRWLEALIWRLATTLIYELPDTDKGAQVSYFSLMAKQQRIQQIEAKAAKAEALAWSEERSRSPLRIAPNISAYTR